MSGILVFILLLLVINNNYYMVKPKMYLYHLTIYGKGWFKHNKFGGWILSNEMNETSRTIELVLGIAGGIFGLIGGVVAVLLGSFAGDEIVLLGISAILASIVGIVGSVYITKDPKIGGIVLVVSAIWLLISISLFGVLGTILLGISGLLAIFRK